MTNANNAGTSGSETQPEVVLDTVKVWDPFVRLFHWSLVGLFVFAYFTGDEWDNAHEWAGYAIAALVAVRVLWGIVGPRHARFSDFVYSPSTIITFLRDSVAMRAKRYIGHNPAGGAMVIGLIIAITAISATGYMMTMDSFWGEEWVEEAHEISVNGTLVLIIGHILGVALASIEHKENLVKSMITGLKRRN
ncbi:cytochrome b/b6 domain-containing protein [Ahrensia sp. 13_GOM-1096m]|uniref:cytochrome b/b6 domain-containing protein n=1 Tax=Ahrensia sp. 13_GOM-1096m TaxID=1380380 RepID=UPI00047B772C|nr:cytochrome b/b6 domain-containing protein [Ahrensia sp. 13_GOM-1096m]